MEINKPLATEFKVPGLAGEAEAEASFKAAVCKRPKAVAQSVSQGAASGQWLTAKSYAPMCEMVPTLESPLTPQVKRI